MAAFKPFTLAITLGAALWLGGCVVAQPLSAEEKGVQNDLDISNYYPATRESRDNIETQPLFAQAAFWGREYDLNPSDLESAIKLSASVRKLGNAQRAVEIAQTTRALYPRDPYLTAEFAAALIASERAHDAMQPLDEGLRIAPNYARLWSLKGAALDQTEQYDLARKHYDRALRITPNDPSILANLGLSYALAGDAPTAETWLRRAASIPGASSGVRQNLALVLQLQGKTAEADKIMRLSRGDQKLPPPPVAAHQPQKTAQPAAFRSNTPQNLRRANPQTYAPQARRPQQRPTAAAQPKPFPKTGELTNEQRALLNQISGNLNPHKQVASQPKPAPTRGYPPQAYTPQNYPQPPAPQTQHNAQPYANTAPRGAARRRR